jgi:hypothetical protein
MKIAKIVSGGQTGADRGGLDAAIACKLPYGGWVPKGRRAEDGGVPSRHEALQETQTTSYVERSEANVVDSDATLVMVCGLVKSASLRTSVFAEKHKKPHLVVNLAADRKEATNRIVEWLVSLPLQEGVLNVAGSRESKVPGIQDVTRAVMINVISRVNRPG